MDISKNKAVLSGVVTQEPRYSHSLSGRDFYKTFIAVKRTSGTEDIIPIVVDEKLPYFDLVRKGECLKVKGMYLSRNYAGADGKMHMALYLFVKSVEEKEPDSEDENKIWLRGYIVSSPTYRITPMSKRRISDVMLATNGKHLSSYTPVVVWNENAEYVSKLPVGALLEVTGMITSREYEKKLEDRVETRTAYEVSAHYVKSGKDIQYE